MLHPLTFLENFFFDNLKIINSPTLFTLMTIVLEGGWCDSRVFCFQISVSLGYNWFWNLFSSVQADIAWKFPRLINIWSIMRVNTFQWTSSWSSDQTFWCGSSSSLFSYSLFQRETIKFIDSFNQADQV